MKKIFLILLILSSIPAHTLSSGARVHKFCEVMDKNKADLIAKISKHHKAELCIKLTNYCHQAEGKIFFAPYYNNNATPVYISKYDSSCM